MKDFKDKRAISTELIDESKVGYGSGSNSNGYSS